MERPYISIITPCYNGEKFIGNAIESLIQQPTQMFEVLIINDGSLDDSEKICENYSQKDKRIKFFTIQNSGAGHARNYGMNQAKGKWIMFLDADDLYLNNCLDDNFINRLKGYEAQNVEVVYSAKCMTDMSIKKEYKIVKCGKLDEMNSIPNMEFWSGIYRKDFLQNNNIAFYEYKRQDIESAFRYLVYVNAKKSIVDNKMIFYVQRLNLESNTHTWNLQVLHEVKCLVYKDLHKKRSTKLAYNQLKTIMLYELIGYYKECCDSGIYSLQALQNMNEVMCEQIHMWYENCKLVGKRNCMKGFVLFLHANISKKKYTINESIKPTVKQEVIQDNKFFARLKCLSELIYSAVEE